MMIGFRYDVFSESGPNHPHVESVVPFFVLDHLSRPFR